MTASMRKLLALAASAALLVTVISVLPGDSTAANLTGGTYTYVVEGEEATFTVDPINRKDGLLLPAEVFPTFDITLEGALGRTVTLKKGEVTATVSLGTTFYQLNGKNDTLPTAPLRLNGRLFLPADLLKPFGVEYALDSTYVTMRDLSAGQPALKGAGQTEWATMRQGKFFSLSTRADSNIYLEAEYTLLTPELISATYFDIAYATRVKLHQLQQTNTLVLVKLSNSTYMKSGGLATNGLYLVDSQRRQVELAQVMEIGQGLLNTKLAPGADRMGVLVYPKVTAAGNLTLYYDSHNAGLGTFTNP